jgi:integrase
MPRSPDMTWVPGRRLWRKVYRGKTYTVSCRQLVEQGYSLLAETKEGSYLAANLWWSSKEDQIEAERKKAERPVSALEQLALSAAGISPNDMSAFLGRLDDADAVLYKYCPELNDGGPSRQLRIVLRRLLEDQLFKGQPLPEDLAKTLSPARAQQLLDGVKAIRGEPAATPDKTLKAHAERWLQRRQEQSTRIGKPTASRVALDRACLTYFVAFLGPDSDVASIDADKVDQFYFWLISADRQNPRKKSWSASYRKEVFAVVRFFIQWCWEQGAVELPRNINNKSSFGSTAPVVKTWTREDFRAAVDLAPNKLKLALLLMANCGMTQQDVSDLRKDEVNLVEGRITRKRSKTKGHGNVPTVDYKLWPVTFELLRKHVDQGGSELVLLTESGKPYIRRKLLEDGRLSKTDGFASNFDYLRERLQKKGIRLGPMKELRKLGATLLAGHKDFTGFRHYFLGHSPRTMADRHYVVPSRERFDEAVLWLGKELGQVETSVGPQS